MFLSLAPAFFCQSFLSKASFNVGPIEKFGKNGGGDGEWTTEGSFLL